MIQNGTVRLETRGHADVHDITEALAKMVAESGLRSGLVTAFSPSSTSAVRTIEFEDGAVRDLRHQLDEILPVDREYSHNARWGDGDGHSHLRWALLGPSLSIPFLNGALAPGTWQQVIHLDFDVRPRQGTS